MFVLVIFQRARDDAELCFERLTNHSVQGAATWIAAFESAAQELKHDAAMHAVVTLRGTKRDPIHSKPFQTPHGKTYQLIYRIRDNEVHVIRVWPPGQRPIRRKDLP